jgi:hypothetical protein
MVYIVTYRPSRKKAEEHTEISQNEYKWMIKNTEFKNGKENI